MRKNEQGMPRQVDERQPVLLERFEARRLISTTAWNSNSISDLSGNYFSTVCVGDNGNPWGVATASAGAGHEESAWVYTQWDSDLDNGLDSGWHSTSFSLNTSGSGGGNWNGNSFSVGSGLSIHSVTIRADVAGPDMEFDWQNVNINFYHNGQVVESQSLNALTASTMNVSGTDPYEAGVIVTTGATNCDGVSISGQVRLKTAQGTYANPTDIFGQVLIN